MGSDYCPVSRGPPVAPVWGLLLFEYVLESSTVFSACTGSGAVGPGRVVFAQSLVSNLLRTVWGQKVMPPSQMLPLKPPAHKEKSQLHKFQTVRLGHSKLEPNWESLGVHWEAAFQQRISSCSEPAAQRFGRQRGCPVVLSAHGGS